MELHQLTVHEAAALLQSGAISARALTDAQLVRLRALQPDVKAYLHVAEKQARRQAEEADEVLSAARRDGVLVSPLTGVPLGIKDVLSLAGQPTTCGSRLLKGYMPPYTATAVEKLAREHAIFLGKTNTDEFAMGSSTENSAYFTTHNPWDLTRVPGGSSGGSAAAVAAGMAIAALGTDTGGSVRQPAALCGVVGLKPSYGRVSRYGLVAFGSSLDQVGTLTKDVTDAALLLKVIAGHDPHDSTSLDVPVPDYRQALNPDVRGVRIGVPKEYFVDGMQPAVEKAVREAIAQLARMGAEVEEISLPNTEYALPVYYLIAPAEASANLARFDGIRYGQLVETGNMWKNFRETRGQGFGPEVKRRIMLGTYALSAGYYDAYYLKAGQVRTMIKADFERAFADVDVIITPTTPKTAFKIGERIDDPLSMYLGDIFTLSVNLAGLCGLSLPCGFDENKLPIGMQILGPSLGEEKILHVAYAYEQATTWHRQRPDI